MGPETVTELWVWPKDRNIEAAANNQGNPKADNSHAGTSSPTQKPTTSKPQPTIKGKTHAQQKVKGKTKQ